MATPISPYLLDAPWPSARGGVRAHGRPASGPQAAAPGVQRFAIGVGVPAAAVIDAEERAYVGDLEGGVHALDLRTGEVRWTHRVDGALRASPALARDGRLIVASASGTVTALTPDGREAWRYALTEEEPTISLAGTRAFGAPVGLDRGGLIVIGNDDFYVYALEADGSLRWATPTGLPVRALAVSDGDGQLLVPGLDMHLYSLVARTGELRWRTPLGNAVSGAPALSSDGTTAVVGTWGGEVRAISVEDGSLRWSRSLAGPVLDGVTAFEDGWVVGTADGRVVRLAADGAVIWERTARAPLYVAPVIGDEPPVIYVATAGGQVHGFEPSGRLMGTWEAWPHAPAGAARALTGVSLGQYGLVVTSLAGEVVYLPWNVYGADPGGWLSPPPFPGPGLALEPPAPRVTAGEVVSLRVVHAGEDEGVRAATVEMPAESTSAWDHALIGSAEGNYLHLVPADLTPGSREVTLSLTYRADHERFAATPAVPITIEPAPEGLPDRFRLVRPRIEDPAMIGAIDAAGLVGFTLDVAEIDQADEGDRGIGWALARRGHEVLRYAFRTERTGGARVFEAAQARVPFAGQRWPLTRLRLALSRADEGSLLAEAAGAEQPLPIGTLLAWFGAPQAVLERSGKPFLAARSLFTQVVSQLPRRPTVRQLVTLGTAAPRTLTLLPKALDPEVWGPWGILDARRRFVGVGRFAAEPLAPTPPPDVEVVQVRADASRRTLRAALAGDPQARRAPLWGLLLVDTSAYAPVDIDYSTRTEVVLDEAGAPSHVRLEIPVATDLGRSIEAWVVADHHVIWRGAITG